MDLVRVAVIGLVVGLVSNRIIVYFRDHGPTFGDSSLRGNGAIVFVLIPLIALVIGVISYARRGQPLSVAIYVSALLLGLFVILGGF